MCEDLFRDLIYEPSKCPGRVCKLVLMSSVLNNTAALGAPSSPLTHSPAVHHSETAAGREALSKAWIVSWFQL